MPVAAASIDSEWASTLVGLRMKIPECWWDGCTSSRPHCGQITSIDSNDKEGRYFQFEIDTEPGEYYQMNYKAVLKYADKKHDSFSRSDFNLPPRMPKAKANKRREISTAKEATAAVTSARPPAATKKEAAKLNKLISSGVVDVIGDINKRLDAGDPATVNFLKTIYDVAEVKQQMKKCLFCEQKFVPGSKLKCSAACIADASNMQFFRDSPYNNTGDWTGTCERCGDGVGGPGDEDWCDERDFPVCYTGPHVSSEVEKNLVILSLQMRTEGSHSRDDFMDAVISDKLAPKDIIKLWSSGSRWSNKHVVGFYNSIPKYCRDGVAKKK